MRTEDVNEKLKNDKFLLESDRLGFTNLPAMTNTIRKAMMTAVKSGNMEPVVQAMGDVYEVLAKRVQIGADAEREMGVMSEIVSKDMDRLMKFSSFMTKLLLDYRKQVKNEENTTFNQRISIEKLKRGSNTVKSAENVQILNIMGEMSEEEKKKVHKMLGFSK